MNKVMLIGNVGKDPEVRYYEPDQCVASFTMATTERGYTLPNGTSVPDHTDWHNIVLFKGLAKYAEQYIHKGDKIYVEGRVRYRNYDDKKGMRRVVTEIYADNIEWLSAPRRQEQASVSTIKESDDKDTDDSKLPF
ncbi:single-stranded DNA-binding protein [Prevotella sp. HUN102]|uniref:single-stranded DNA-binding protein n=1 Tax=Prevotella sp. HUN102 TaxID=1392486 RepID=UPI00048C82ED|nr:single-stranded DNA-binding protein [Prevotella sp. HUN102]